MTRRVKVACATITPSGSDKWKGQTAGRSFVVKAGNASWDAHRWAAPVAPPISLGTLVIQQFKRARLFLDQLHHRALVWRFIGPPPQETGAMTKSPSRDVVERHLDYKFGP